MPLPADHVVEAAERLTSELAGVREVLTAATASVRLVLTPEAVVVAEARRSWTTLSLFGYQVDAVVANRLVPDAPADAWRSGWARAQAERLAEVAAGFAPVPVLTAPYLDHEPVGVEALAGLAEQLYGPAGAAAAEALTAPPRAESALSVERDGTAFTLRLYLPLAQRRDVDLSRRGDDLIVDVAGHRRVLALPSALRRCRVTGARLRDDVLRIGFEPDPDLWRPL
jgi:arsenite-transporting ATPase